MSTVPTPDDPGQATERNPTQLLKALTVALHELRSGNPVSALRESFASARAGLRAQKALLLYVHSEPPNPDLEILYSSGLSKDQQLACREGRSCDGVSPTVIQDAIRQRHTIYIPNTQAHTDYQATASLSGAHRSVLCAPILDPHTAAPVAVLYFQNKLAACFEDDDRFWLEAYAEALSQGLGLHLAKERRIEELEEQARRLQKRDRSGAPEIIGDSLATRRLRQTLHEVFLPATTRGNPRPILILGESGTGKEIVARYLHYWSPTRMKGPFVPHNCASLRGDTAQSVLFGHVRGSFTGAVTDQMGLFRQAHRGVLFLDEVGDMPLEAQALLLRVLETHSVQPLGQAVGIDVDVQIVLATHRDLQQHVQDGRFRNDLWARINALPIHLQPLGSMERAADIPQLLSHCLARQEREWQKKTAGLSPEAYQALLEYAWPNNVRELDSVCTALVASARHGERIDLHDLRTRCPQVLTGPRQAYPATATFKEAKRLWARTFIETRLATYDGDVPLAAKSLGMGRNVLWNTMRRYGISAKYFGPRAAADHATENAP